MPKKTKCAEVRLSDFNPEFIFTELQSWFFFIMYGSEVTFDYYCMDAVIHEQQASYLPRSFYGGIGNSRKVDGNSKSLVIIGFICF